MAGKGQMMHNSSKNNQNDDYGDSLLGEEAEYKRTFTDPERDLGACCSSCDELFTERECMMTAKNPIPHQMLSVNI